MTSDNERREVARRLREREDELTYDSISLEKGLIDIVGKDGCDYVRRLADLIEPCDMSHGCRDTVACDRDALLALADDVDGAADDSGGFEPLAGMLRDIARSIREAVGVES